MGKLDCAASEVGDTRSLLDSILRFGPRFAAFDCDGTLWSGDSGNEFLLWTIQQRIVSPAVVDRIERRYAEYKAGRVNEETMCGDMVTMYAGLSVDAMEAAARAFFQEFMLSRIYPEMAELVSRLLNSGCDVWLVSSTNEWVIREGARHLQIDPLKVLGAAVERDGSIVTARLKHVPTGPGKARTLREIALRQNQSRALDAAFGNSIHDLDMLRMARFPVAVNPTEQLQAIASQASWAIYFTTA
jgi:HAD superfamily hydrolase (TIGR01490 family)